MGQHHMQQALVPRKIFNLSRFQLRLWHGSKSRQGHQHHKGCPHPGIHNQNGGKGPDTGAQKIDGYAEGPFNEIIQNPEYGVVDDLKKRAGGERRKNHGGKNEGQGNPSEGEVFAAPEDESQNNPEERLGAGADDYEQEGVTEGMPDLKAVEYLIEVGQPNKFERCAGDQDIFIETQSHQPEKGDHVPHNKEDENRDKQEMLQVFGILQIAQPSPEPGGWVPLKDCPIHG